MNIYEVGRLCVKIAGRDAGNKCVVVEKIDDNYVLVDGNVRRKKVNTKHLEPLEEVIEIKNKASHEDVAAAFKKQGLETWERKSKQAGEKPVRQRKVKPAKAEAAPKKAVKKKAAEN